MRLLALLGFTLFAITGSAIPEIELGPADRATEADFCMFCNGAKARPNAPAGKLEKLPADAKAAADGCGERCRKLLKIAKAEGMRCPHEWAQFQKIKHHLRGNADACAWYREHGKDPTQWSKGLCATALYSDFIRTGIPVEIRAAAREWKSMLEQPRYHMRKLDITDPMQAPRGAVLVYSNQSPGKYGHIEVAMGDEFCSDYCYPVAYTVKAPGARPHLIGAYMPEDGAG